MQISNFQPKQPPKAQKNIIRTLFMLQKYRQFSIQKPQSFVSTSKITNLPQNFQNTIKINDQVTPILKQKLVNNIRKNNLINFKKQRKVQRLYKTYLEHFLNISNIEAAMKKQSPSLSVLESKDEGDYLLARNLDEYEKKDYPHYSNAIKITQIPNQQQIIKTKISQTTPLFRKPQKKHWDIEDNCIYKIKKIFKFTKQLFYKGYEEFQPISQATNISVKNCKLLFDVYQDYFKIDQRIESARSQTMKKSIKRVNRFIIKALKKYMNQSQQSFYVGLDQNFISLKEFRICLTKKMQENSSSQSQQKAQQ